MKMNLLEIMFKSFNLENLHININKTVTLTDLRFTDNIVLIVDRFDQTTTMQPQLNKAVLAIGGLSEL